MNTEKARLDKMLQEHKISQEDYTILATALKRKTIFNKIHSTFLLNPFQNIAGTKALFLGLITLILTSILGVKARLYYLSPMSTINASIVTKQVIIHPMTFLLYQNIVCWLAFAILLIMSAKVFQKNKIRIIDFLGTVALARFPTLIVTLYVLAIRVLKPNLLDFDFSKGYPVHFSFIQYFFSVPVIVIAIWQAAIYFYAYKESSGLTGKKLMLSFLAILVLAECITPWLTTLFMN